MKGQRYRFFANDVPFQAETSCELHISVETEESYNKDFNNNCAWPVAVGYSFDASIECQVKNFSSDKNNYYVPADLTPGEPIDLELCRTTEDSTTSYDATIASGKFIPTSISYKADNKKTVTASIKLEGTGVLTL